MYGLCHVQEFLWTAEFFPGHPIERNVNSYQFDTQNMKNRQRVVDKTLCNKYAPQVGPQTVAENTLCVVRTLNVCFDTETIVFTWHLHVLLPMLLSGAKITCFYSYIHTHTHTHTHTLTHTHTHTNTYISIYIHT
jgi:hypothetical protein